MMKDSRFLDADVPNFTPVGTYPVIGVTEDGALICPTCMNGGNEGEEFRTEDEPQWNIAEVGVNWEDPDVYCGHCGKHQEPAYPDD